MTVDEAFRAATQHHAAGRLADAESLYRQILSAAPDQPETLYYLGILYCQAGHPQQAIPVLERVAANPNLATAEPHANLAAAYAMVGDHERAITAARTAVSRDPRLTQAWTTLAVSLVTLQRLDEAIPAWDTLTTLIPTSPEPWSNLAVTYERLGRLAEGESAARRAVTLNPNYAAGQNNLGAILAALGRLEEARAAHLAAIQADPNFSRAYVNLSHTALQAGRIDEAIDAARHAVALTHNDADAHRNLAASLQEKGEVAAAADAYASALGILDPITSSAAPNDAARAVRNQIKLVSATLLPPVYESADDLSRWRARLEEGFASLSREGLRADISREPVPVLFALAYHGRDDRPLMQQYASLVDAPHPPIRHKPHATGRINIGFISRFFRDHTIGRLNLGLVERLDREKFHVTVFSVGDYQDETSARFRSAADRFVALPPQLAPARDRVAAESCDILFYTDLGMDPVTFSLAFTRLAPVQCTTWGHPVTSGSPNIDYFISAKDLEPQGSESQYTERLVKLDDLAVYYHRPPQAATSLRDRKSFGLEEDWRLYGCLQMLWKFHPDFDALLAGVLRADPKGRLVLIRGLNHAWDDKLSARWQRTMPDVADRIVWLPRLSREDFLALSNLCNVMLDPPHFCGGNTSYEALAYGTPVITLPSQFLRGRLTYAMARQISAPELIATSRDDYITRGTTLAQNSKDLRSTFAERASILFENLNAVRALESFFLLATGN